MTAYDEKKEREEFIRWLEEEGGYINSSTYRCLPISPAWEAWKARAKRECTSDTTPLEDPWWPGRRTND